MDKQAFNLGRQMKPVQPSIQDVVAIARAHADSVDIEGRFPIEAIDALKESGLLGLIVPETLEGKGKSLLDAMMICFLLGQVCGSTAMIFAMHQAIMAPILNHCGDSPWHSEFCRKVATASLLIGSSTTEAGTGGDVTKSVCSLKMNVTKFSISKNAPVISYGKQADALCITARKSAESPATGQAIIVLLSNQYHLMPVSPWNALGMRGTCSEGFKIEGTGDVAQILPTSFEQAHLTGLPWTHLLWSSVWLGIATNAVTRARLYVRQKAGSGTNQHYNFVPVAAELQALKRSIYFAAVSYIKRSVVDIRANSIGSIVELNGLKITASESAQRIVLSALSIVGLSGYLNSGPFSMSRHIRDILSASAMISNNRIISDTLPFSLVSNLDEKWEFN
jgi:acyl-CoA dehydrogenase